MIYGDARPDMAVEAKAAGAAFRTARTDYVWYGQIVHGPSDDLLPRLFTGVTQWPAHALSG